MRRRCGGPSLSSLRSDGSGNFVVVWMSNTQDGSSNGVFGQVGADSAGNFIVAWSSDAQGGSGYGVFGQRYGQIVPVELMHFRVE